MSANFAISRQPTLLRLAASFIYDTLVVIAFSFLISWLFITVFGDATQGLRRVALQLVLWLFIGVYFIWCWSKSGQTLAMHTWRLKLVNEDGVLPNFPILGLRYLLATLSLMLLGVGFLWALLDRDKCYLHDRILKTRIIQQPKT